METHLPNKFLHAHRKSHVTCAMRRDNLTNQRTVHSIYMLLWSFWKTWAKSVVKAFLYNCLIRLCSQTAGIHLQSNNRIYCVSSARSEVQVVYVIYENDIQWLLLYFLWYLVPQFTRKWRFCSLWLIGWKRWFIRKCFMRYSSFAHKFNLNLWMKT